MKPRAALANCNSWENPAGDPENQGGQQAEKAAKAAGFLSILNHLRRTGQQLGCFCCGEAFCAALLAIPNGLRKPPPHMATGSFRLLVTKIETAAGSAGFR
jgi:hypothetical protein